MLRKELQWVLVLTLALAGAACDKDSEGGDGAEGSPAVDALNERVTEIRADLAAGENARYACAAASAAADSLAEADTGEAAQLAITAYRDACEFEEPMVRAASELADARTALEEDRIPSIACDLAKTAVAEDVPEARRSGDAYTALLQEITDFCDRDAHLQKARGHLDAARSAILNAESSTIDCSYADTTLNGIGEAYAEDEAVVAMRAEHPQVCNRDLYVASIRSRLSEAQVAREADPDSSVIGTCAGMRTELGQIDEAFAADELVLGVATEITALCGE